VAPRCGSGYGSGAHKRRSEEVARHLPFGLRQPGDAMGQLEAAWTEHLGRGVARISAAVTGAGSGELRFGENFPGTITGAATGPGPYGCDSGLVSRVQPVRERNRF
jgi:hypothetical protein